jgi:putative copper export protein
VIFVIWAIGAVPALVLAAAVAARPRLPRVVAGMTILEVMIIGATYLVALAVAGHGQ